MQIRHILPMLPNELPNAGPILKRLVEKLLFGCGFPVNHCGADLPGVLVTDGKE